MTREEIEQLPAGPQTDVLIHEKVLGLQASRYVGQDWKYVEACYSVDMTDAWYLVDRLQGLGYTVAIHTVGKEKIAVTITEPDKNNGVLSPWPKSYSAASDDAPLALCRAALLTTLSPTP